VDDASGCSAGKEAERVSSEVSLSSVEISCERALSASTTAFSIIDRTYEKLIIITHLQLECQKLLA